MALPVAVITGATSGIGRHIAIGLARAGRHLVVIGRGRERTEQAASDIREAVRGASVEVQIADLSLLNQTRRAAEAIASAHPRIQLLVNNAGMFTMRRTVTAEGHEAVLAVNHLSPTILQDVLEPALCAGALSRIVNVGSSMSERAAIDPDDLELERGWGYVRAYSRSKLALLMGGIDRAARLRRRGVSVNTVHPGSVATSLIREEGATGLVWRMMRPLMMTEEQGAAGPLHVALSREFREFTGTYVRRCKPVPPNRRALDAALRARVQAATQALIARTPAAPD